MLAHDRGIVTPKTLWLGGGARRGNGWLACQEAPTALEVAAIVRLGRADINGRLPAASQRAGLNRQATIPGDTGVR